MPPKSVLILLLNPSVLMRRLIEKHLVEMGYKNIGHATNPIEAAVTLKQLHGDGNGADLIITEEMLGEFHTLAWLTSLREEPRFAALRAILLTTGEEPAQPTQPSEQNAFLRRPFTVESLAARMRDVFRSTRDASDDPTRRRA